MSPLDKLIMKTLKKNVQIFIRCQIKFYLEFSRRALLTFGPASLKDLRADGQNAQISTHIISIFSHQYVISPSHSTAHGTFRVEADFASEEEECSPFPGFIWF